MAEKFMKERVDRMKKREQNRKQYLDKKRTVVKNIKGMITTGMQYNKRAEKEKIGKQKEKQTKEKIAKSMLGFMGFKKEGVDKIKEKLEKERETAQSNSQIVGTM